MTIGDRVMIHCSGGNKSFPTEIGNNTVIGSGAVVHGCVIGAGSSIGEGSQVLDGASIGSGSIVGAGSIVTSGKVVPDGQLWSGVPAVFQRQLTKEETQRIALLAEENILLASSHAKEGVKDWETIELEEFDYEQQVGRNSSYYKRLTREELAIKLGEIENHTIPGRILDSPVSSRDQPASRP